MCARQLPAHDDNSAQSAEHCQAGQLGCCNSALEASDDGVREAQLAFAADRESVLSKQLGDLGINEGDRPQSPPRTLHSPGTPRLLEGAAARPVSTHQQRMSQAAASVAASHPEPLTTRDALPDDAATSDSAAQPALQDFMLGRDPPCGAAASELLTGCHPNQSAPASGSLPYSTEPHRPTQQQHGAPCSSAAQHSRLTASQTEHSRVHAVSAPPTSRACGSGRHRPADPQAGALLLCPITQVRHPTACA